MEAFDRNADGSDPSLYENFLWMMPSLQPENCEYKPEAFAETECSESAMFFFDHPFTQDDIAAAGFWPMYYPQEHGDYKPQQIQSVALPKPIMHYNSSKRIGTLTYEERRIKLEKYLEKRKRRSFSKKISYNCRKRVADSRIRVKGRFITKAQAQVLKGLENSKNSVSLPSALSR